MQAMPDPSSEEADKQLWHRWRPWLIVSLTAIATLALLALALIVLPPMLVPRGTTTFAELAKAESDVRGNLVAALGVIAVLIGAVVGFLNLRETQRQNRLARQRDHDQLELTRRGQVNERFSKAIEQLGQGGTEKVDVRIGAIYSLEQIARDSPELLHGPIVETLTAFLRGHSGPLGQKSGSDQEPGSSAAGAVRDGEVRLRADFQAVATVLGRRAVQPETQSLDLRGVSLGGANLYGAHLERADLTAAHLEKAGLTEAHLEGATLDNAHLEGAFLVVAHLEKATLYRAHLEHALLIDAHLEGAFLSEAHLEEAYLAQGHLEEATLDNAHLVETYLGEAHLEKADLRGAHLEKANLEGAHLEKANLEGAHLEGAILRGEYLTGFDAIGLTPEQLALALWDKSTKLPSYLQELQREGVPTPDE